jgi:hypothetical protein
MQPSASILRSLYDALAVPVSNDSGRPQNPGRPPEDPRRPPPETTFTATIETIDNDRAYSLLYAHPKI